ncbi:uracil-DNA glycosylase [Deferrisoma sp.]
MPKDKMALPPGALETLRFAAYSGAWLVPGEPAHETEGPPRGPPPGRTLAEVRRELGDCRRCRLWSTRTQIVFGTGNPDAELLFVGEAPGFHEDLKGEPFVGRAGQLLDRMIRAIGLERDGVYIANVLKCRPPDNRDPLEDEVETCLPFLWGQIEAVRPRVICALGAHAARAILGESGSLSALRGGVRSAGPWPVVVTYHPAFLLRQPRFKRQAWEDLKRVRALLAPPV